jgi:hypothetical protein
LNNLLDLFLGGVGIDFKERAVRERERERGRETKH